jgi:hypothetical protein
MHGIKGLRSFGRKAQKFCGRDSQPRALEAAQNFTDEISAHRIGLDDR